MMIASNLVAMDRSSRLHAYIGNAFDLFLLSRRHMKVPPIAGARPNCTQLETPSGKLRSNSGHEGGDPIASGGNEIDTSAAEAYEAFMVSAVFRTWAEFIVGLAALEPGDRVLDVACGTGIGARIAAERVAPDGKVTGLDIDPGMIEVARDLAADAGVANDWHVASALEMPFADDRFDLCLCLQGLQFFPDRAAGLSECRRVLRPDGRLFASLWRPIEDNAGHLALARALEHQNVDSAPVRRPFSFADAREIRQTAKEAGFGTVEVRTEERLAKFHSIEGFIDSLAAGAVSARHALVQVPDDRRGDFVDDVKGSLKAFVTGNGLELPTRSHIVIATP
jgi:ubiquinone/menaquinone biosynthesis C-methylase UbiE